MNPKKLLPLLKEIFQKNPTSHRIHIFDMKGFDRIYFRWKGNSMEYFNADRTFCGSAEAPPNILAFMAIQVALIEYLDWCRKDVSTLKVNTVLVNFLRDIQKKYKISYEFDFTRIGSAEFDFSLDVFVER